MINIRLTWENLKYIIDLKHIKLQYVETNDSYDIFALDDQIHYRTIIFIGDVPDDTYDQVQNDLDKTDFEDNYKDTSNDNLIKYAATGVFGVAPAKGLGGFVPNPINDPYEPDIDETSALYVDGEGSLVTRGAVLTDEGSFRDDFAGSALETNLTGTVIFTNGSNVITGAGTAFLTELTRDVYVKATSHDYTNWVKVVRTTSDTSAEIEEGYPGATVSITGHKTFWITTKTNDSDVAVSSSKITLSSGVDATASINIQRFADYSPMIGFWKVSASQRIVNQTIFFGFRDIIDSPSMYCEVILDGTSNTSIKFRSAWNNDEELSTITLPNGLNTSQSLKYKIDVAPDYCGLLVNNILVAKHDNHIPGMYSELTICAGIENSAMVTSTDVEIDSFYFSNQNLLQISTSFMQPLPTIVREDQHTINGKLTTTLTTSNQTILSYEVPSGKVFHVIGYRIDCDGTSSGTIKIGRDDVSLEPDSPGVVDGNLFRIFDLNSNSSTGDIDFAIPRKIGASGDTILVVVTPTAALATTWRANLDFVLR